MPNFGKGSWTAPTENTLKTRTFTCLSVILTQDHSKKMASRIVTIKAKQKDK